MSHYVISDLHGESDRFHSMLEKIHFSSRDILYVLGDVVDRGPDGVPLLQEILGAPNMVMLLGNHEYMCLQYHSPHATEVEIRRWARNGNGPTLLGLERLRAKALERLLWDLEALPTHLEVTVAGRRFYLVHGFPGANTHDEVWGRPRLDTPNPIPGTTLIIGHTPIVFLDKTPEEQEAYSQALTARGDHMRILHAPGFLDIDCGCGHQLPIKALACLRLEDLAEFYV